MSEIVIYEDGNVEIKKVVENESIGLSQKQLCELFGRDKSVVSRHINNIFKDKEVEEKSNMQKMHIANSDKPVKFYSLDIVLAVGYRTNSAKAIKFRQWATRVLKEYIIKGYTLNQERIKEKKLQELEQTISLIKQGLENRELSLQEAKGFVKIVSNYAKSWALLQGYDEQSLEEVSQTCETRFVLDYDEANEAIAELKRTLIAKSEATKLFGQEKVANLLYYVIKGHPFNDDNKRIGAYLFILFLHKNGILYKTNGEAKINDNALASLALLVATSAPEQKDIIIKLVMNMLVEGE